jgi:CDP-diglyceride synthetase
MLGQRVITAVVLLCLLAVLLQIPSHWPFLIFLSVTCALAAWEWSRLLWGRGTRIPQLMGVMLFVVTIVQAWWWTRSGSLDQRWLLWSTVRVFLQVVLALFSVVGAPSLDAGVLR